MKKRLKKSCCGLVLTGGGARAAYQGGVLRGISEILSEEGIDENPFHVIAGVSAGALNGVFLGASGKSFSKTTHDLYQLWDDVEPSTVLKSDVRTLAKIGLGWIRDLTSGGLGGPPQSTCLLDTSPLRDFLGDNLNFDSLRHNIESGNLRGIAVSATNYSTGTAVSFYDAAPEVENWARSSRIGERSKIKLEHVLASASIPIFFKPVRIAQSYFGDGGIRLSTPLSPAIHMGAERILTIGIRYYRSVEETFQLNLTQKMDTITLADIGGVLLNALFLDALDADIERLERINKTLSLLPPERKVEAPHFLRPIPLLAVRPSQDLGLLASEQFHRLPTLLRFLMKGVGASPEKGWDFVSYLAFDHAYTGILLKLGRADALAHKQELLDFLLEEA
jgi:NTE family protein